MSSPCAPWVSVEELCGSCGDLTPDDDIALDASLAASDVLYNFTKKKYPGECTDIIRPCRTCSTPGGWGGSWWGWWASLMSSAAALNTPPCGCGFVPEIVLPGRPVISVDSVKVDGVLLDPSDYRLDDQNKLVRVDGNPWPSCQNILLDDTEHGTMSVEYTFGTAPPPAGVRMAKILGCELAAAFSRDKSVRDKCQLPKRVTTISRQNVTLAMLDPLSLFKDGQTGIAVIDMWVQADLYGDQQREAAFIDPAKPRLVRRTR